MGKADNCLTAQYSKLICIYLSTLQGQGMEKSNFLKKKQHLNELLVGSIGR